MAEEEGRAVRADFAAAADCVDELLAVRGRDERVLDLDIDRADSLQDVESQPLCERHECAAVDE